MNSPYWKEEFDLYLGGGRSRFIEAPTKGVVNNSRIITVSTALMYRSVLAVCKVWNL